MVLASQRVLRPDGGFAPATIHIDAGRITAVEDRISPQAEQVDLAIVPGYVDTHCHGAAGADFTDEDPQKVRAAIEHHRANGTTTQFASTVTERMDDLVDQIHRLRPLVAAGELAGIHAEGPFLAENRRGAHNPELLRDPSDAAVTRLLQAGEGDLRAVTLAPEREYGIRAVQTLTAHRVHAAFGHSDADAGITREAVDAGADVVTHLFNAMAPIHHREPGPVPWLLTDSRTLIELICDGVHVAPDVLRMAIRTAGVERVALVTDAMSATGQPDGRYMLGTLPVQVDQGRARIRHADGSLGAIAGSTLTMGGAVEFLVGSVGVALADAATMAATTPARWYGLDEVGVIEEGRLADLCLVDDAGHVERVIRHGEEVDRSTVVRCG